MEVAWEERTEGTVNETADENLVVAGFSLTLCETAREASRSGILLSVLYLQRHEICSWYCIFCGADCSEKDSVAHTECTRAVSLLRQFSCLDGYLTSVRQRDCFCNYIHFVIKKHLKRWDTMPTAHSTTLYA